MIMKIREIILIDYKQLISFWKENYFVNELDNLKQFKLFLKINPNLSILAEDDGKIIGTALGSFDGRRGYIQKLVVSKNWRGKGFGKKLLESVVKKLHAVGAKYIPISCEKEMIPFYESSGFRKTNQITVSNNAWK